MTLICIQVFSSPILYIRCCVLVVVLPLLPWAPLLRLVGAVLFGPHNYPIWREWRREQQDYELGLTLVKRRAYHYNNYDDDDDNSCDDDDDDDDDDLCAYRTYVVAAHACHISPCPRVRFAACRSEMGRMELLDEERERRKRLAAAEEKARDGHGDIDRTCA